MSAQGEFELIAQTYDRLDYEHHGRMHRGGLIYLVASYLGLSEEEVLVAIDLRYGWVDDDLTDNDAGIHHDQQVLPEDPMGTGH